jgi:hypothetical protein
MTDEARKKFYKAGSSTISCPKCGCVGLEYYDMSKLRSGCISREDGQFLDCEDCLYEHSPYECKEYRRVFRNYQIMTVYFNKTVELYAKQQIENIEDAFYESVRRRNGD